MTTPWEDEMGTDKQPEPGQDSRVDDWLGQSVERDAELAEELVEEADGDVEDAERRFDERATGEDEQDARRGEQIDPDGGRSAYSDDA
jgi:hypothetical protein